jgi:hypothetical protein
MKVTKVARKAAGDTAVGTTNAAGNVKMGEAAKGNKPALPVAQRGPKVLQSHQARQRCLQFSRG